MKKVKIQFADFISPNKLEAIKDILSKKYEVVVSDQTGLSF